MMRFSSKQTNCLKVLLACTLGLGSAQQVSAVITLQSEFRNTVPPAAIQPAWNLQGQFLLFNATPISPSHFIAARHIFTLPDTNPSGAGYTFSYQAQNYTTASFADIPGTDLRVWQVNTQGGTRAFPTWAPIWNPAVDGSEEGKPLVVFGRGVGRTEAIYAPIVPGTTADTDLRQRSRVLTSGVSGLSGPSPTSQGDLRGWKWGTVDAIASWGRNNVEFTLSDEAFGELIGFNFDSGAAAVADEAILARNDSSGGVFAQDAAGQWKLIGVNLGVDGPWSFTPTGPYFDAAIFDARGLYIGSATNNFEVPATPGPLPAASYSTRVSSYYDQLSTITGGFAGTSGPASLVPEPTSALVLLTSMISVRRRRRTASQ